MYGKSKDKFALRLMTGTGMAMADGLGFCGLRK